MTSNQMVKMNLKLIAYESTKSQSNLSIKNELKMYMKRTVFAHPYGRALPLAPSLLIEQPVFQPVTGIWLTNGNCIFWKGSICEPVPLCHPLRQVKLPMHVC